MLTLPTPAHSAPPVAVTLGTPLTVAVAEPTPTHPSASVTVTVYVVVAPGVARGFAMFVALNPAAGLHTYVYGPAPPDGVALKLTLPTPAHSAPPVAVTLGNPLTVAVAEPT